MEDTYFIRFGGKYYKGTVPQTRIGVKWRSVPTYRVKPVYVLHFPRAPLKLYIDIQRQGVRNMLKAKKIKILKDGPLLVTGNIPLSEKNIVPVDRGREYRDVRVFNQTETYALCRCGKSSNAPFCDGTHQATNFNGEETASRALYKDRAEILPGKNLDLLDDSRCAMAHFCYRKSGNAWDLIENADDESLKKEAIRAASECPAGRLTAVTKDGVMLEPEYEPAIEILQDEKSGVGCGIFVKGSIPIESSDGHVYEVRNRVMLCRCGKSNNKPFCDATHVKVGFVAHK
jgi:CDGSH-type Zn-finger protein